MNVTGCRPIAARRLPPCLPRTTAEVSAALRLCWEEGVPVVPRGSGTSLAGGAMPTSDAVVLGVARMNAVLETDYETGSSACQAGRTNLSVTGAVEADGFFYAPDPSQPAGLRHCREHRNELGRGALPEIRGDDKQSAGRDRLVLMDGSVLTIGGAIWRAVGLDLSGRDLRVGRAVGRCDRGLAAHPAKARRGAAGADGV
jgi:glycolate oxidase